MQRQNLNKIETRIDIYAMILDSSIQSETNVLNWWNKNEIINLDNHATEPVFF